MKTSEDSCGIRLVRLINTRLLDIVKEENRNDGLMCLYGTGSYWNCFERSAYHLNRLFPKLKPYVLNHPQYPFPILGVSVPEKDFRRYIKEHNSLRRGDDYLEFTVSPTDKKAYGAWHTKEVNDFMNS